MTKINIYSIAKNKNDEYDKLINDLIKSSSKFAKVTNNYIFNKEISKAQTINPQTAKGSYTDAFLPYMKGYSIALDPKGKKLDSFDFAKLLENGTNINFFIGGAFGFDEKMLQKCNAVISLSDLTLAHKLATLLLSEQIFRGLCINNNHPYHK